MGNVVVRALGWRWMVDSPLLLATWITFAAGVLAVLDVGSALGRAESVRGEVMQELARLAAEAAAIEAGEGGGDTELAVGEFLVGLERAAGALLLTVRNADGERWRFRCEQLTGAAPGCFGQRLTAADPQVPVKVREGSSSRFGALPELDEAALAAAPRGEMVPGIVADPSLALLHWNGGTEGPDYVFADRFAGADWKAPAGGVVVVPGHLWVPPRADGRVLHLERDLTVVVEGNLYVAGSLHVHGSGRLVIVTRSCDHAVPFADRDGNGRWSTGDVARAAAFAGRLEGGGNVYFGLPQRAWSSEDLCVDASIVAAGELHLAARTQVAGAVVLPFGLTELAAEAQLQLSGRHLFNVQRERVPGFLTEGPPRPGVLRVGFEAAEPAAEGREQPLYLAASPR